MKTLIGMALVAVPMALVASGDVSAGTLTLAGLVGAGCWVVSGWLSS